MRRFLSSSLNPLILVCLIVAPQCSAVCALAECHRTDPAPSHCHNDPAPAPECPHQLLTAEVEYKVTNLDLTNIAPDALSLIVFQALVATDMEGLHVSQPFPPGNPQGSLSRILRV